MELSNQRVLVGAGDCRLDGPDILVHCKFPLLSCSFFSEQTSLLFQGSAEIFYFGLDSAYFARLLRLWRGKITKFLYPEGFGDLTE